MNALSSCTVFRSWLDFARRLVDDSERGKFWQALIAYALDGQEPKDDGGAAFGIFMLLRPTIDASNRRRADGRRGGLVSGGRFKPAKDTPKDTPEPTPKETRSEEDEEVEKEGEKEGEKRRSRAKTALALDLPFATVAFRDAWQRWQDHRKEIRHPLKPTAEKAQLERLAAMGEQRALACIQHSISNGWQGLFEPDSPAKTGKAARPVWSSCAKRCNHWDEEKAWCKRHVQQEPKSCEACEHF